MSRRGPRLSWRIVIVWSALVAATPHARAHLVDYGSAKFDINDHWIPELDYPYDLTFLPDGRTVVVLKGGDVVVRLENGTVINPAGHVDIRSGEGLISVAAHPRFDQNRIVFFYGATGPTVARRMQVFTGQLGDDNRFTFNLAKPIVDGMESGEHHGGALFVYRSQLYVSVGDAGAMEGPPSKYGSCLNNPNGKILRLELDGSIPADNPLVGMGQVTACTPATKTSGGFTMAPPDERIYAWGLRDPLRFWIDPATGLLWVGDSGRAKNEEISIGTRGTHFGYPFVEGNQQQPSFATFGGCKGMTPGTDCTAPVYQYKPMAAGTLGGFTGDLCGWPREYKDRYLFAGFNESDFDQYVWMFDLTSDHRAIYPKAARLNFAKEWLNVSMRIGHGDKLYLVRHRPFPEAGGDVGGIWTIWPQGRPAACDKAPLRLDGVPPPAPPPFKDAGAPDAKGAGASDTRRDDPPATGQADNDTLANDAGASHDDAAASAGCSFAASGRPHATGLGFLVVLGLAGLILAWKAVTLGR